MIEVFSELHQIDPEVFKAQVGLDEDDFADTEIQEVLDVYNEVKHGLDEDDQEDEGEESEEEREEEQVDDEDDDDQGMISHDEDENMLAGSDTDGRPQQAEAEKKE